MLVHALQHPMSTGGMRESLSRCTSTRTFADQATGAELTKLPQQANIGTCESPLRNVDTTGAHFHGFQ